MSQYERQIEELNEYVKTRLAPSPIHGVGVFALRDMKKGEKLHTDMIPKIYNLPFPQFIELRPEVREQILSQFPQVVNGSAFAHPTTRLQAYMNHADEPNSDGDVLLRDVKEGEEITEDYRRIPNYELVFTFIK